MAGAVTAGCAAEPGRTPGPGAFVAGVGGGLVRVHDAVAQSLLGDAAKPMLIAPPAPRDAADAGTPEHARPASVVLARRQVASTDLSASDVANATSADLDGDGTVSLDEILALGRSGLDDAEVLERLERTGRTFELSSSQEEYLRVRGIRDDLVSRLRTLNRPTTAGMAAAHDAVGAGDANDPPPR